jgi:hypothetical protein
MNLVKLVLTLALVALVLYEGAALAVNHVQTDDLAQRALRAAERAGDPAGVGQTDAVTAAEQVVAGHPRARLDAVGVEGSTVTVTVTQDARVIVLDRLGPLSDLAVTTITKRSSGP